MNVENGWVVVSQLRTGGLGEVYKCQTRRGALFAAKFSKDTTGQWMIDDEDRRLQRHQGPGVVEYMGPVAHPDGRIGYAMELMQGDLRDLLRWRRFLPPAEALGRLLPIVDVLVTIHRSAPGAFHGDLKLANILYRGGITKLADFGLARGGVGQTVMLGPHMGGTPGYMPPEGLASAHGDVYSLGAVFWAVLVGREPVAGEGLAVQIPGHGNLERLVNTMLSPQGHSRPSMDEVRQELAAIHAELQHQRHEQWREFGKFASGALVVAGVIALLSAATKA